MAEDNQPQANKPTRIAHWQTYKNRQRPMTAAEVKAFEAAMRGGEKETLI